MSTKAIIEISQGNLDRIKYEIDSSLGTLRVDRLLTCPLPYPANYGFIPNTLAPDGDCTDILVIFPSGIQPTSVIDVRVIGALEMEDENGIDIKIVSVPSSHITDMYDHITQINDIAILKESIEHFFSSYKNEEEHMGRWVEIYGWIGASEAESVIQRHRGVFYQNSFRIEER